MAARGIVGAWVLGGLVAVGLQDTSAEVFNASWIGLVYLWWVLIPAICTLSTLAWVGTWTARRWPPRQGRRSTPRTRRRSDRAGLTPG